MDPTAAELDRSHTIGQPAVTLYTAIRRDDGQADYTLLPLAAPQRRPSTSRIGNDVMLVFDIAATMAAPHSTEPCSPPSTSGGSRSRACAVKLDPQSCTFERPSLAPSGAVT